MYSRNLKIGYFVLEGLNSFATTYYFYYFYFFMQQAFGFGNKANLLLAALNGAVYAVWSLWGGRFAERFGYFTALKLGFFLMMGSMAVGSQLHSAGGQVLVMVAAVIGMCFTWPTLEALVSGGERRAGLQDMVGVYNVVWAGTGALAYFTGGAMLEKLGLGSMFYVPGAIQAVQLALTFWLESKARASGGAAITAPAIEDDPHPHPAAHTGRFLRMSWLANPFAYVAMNTLIAVMPGVASRLGLSTMLAGFCCSVWCFARVGAFVLLWRWTAWHYRFRWLLAAYIALIVTFALILTVPNLAAVIAAQVVFGGAIGLIYYSSLFYSMDLSEAKGEHGGIHEAAIGVGNFAGPIVGAAALYMAPQYAYSGAVAVSVLLLCGLGGLTTIWRSGK